MNIQPTAPRYTLEELGPDLTVHIPAQRSCFVMGFLSFWLVGWFAGVVFAGSSLVSTLFRGGPVADGSTIFLFVWLSIWLVGGCFALYTLLWMLVGREVVSISNAGLQITKQIFGLGLPKRYQADYIENLRVDQPANNPYVYRRSSTPPGLLVFHYGADMVRFGSGLNPVEAERLLGEITARFPRYRSDPVSDQPAAAW